MHPNVAGINALTEFDKTLAKNIEFEKLSFEAS